MSVTLKALLTHTSQTTIMTPSHKGSPKTTGLRPDNTAALAATNWPASFCQGRSGRTSSRRPTAAAVNTPAVRPGGKETLLPISAHTPAPAAAAARMEIPPVVGMESRERGDAATPTRKPSHQARGVSRSEKRKAGRNQARADTLAGLRQEPWPLGSKQRTASITREISPSVMLGKRGIVTSSFQTESVTGSGRR